MVTIQKRVPLEVKRLGIEGLRVSWSDGTVHEIPSGLLRKHCPSATSRAERGDTSHDKPLSGKGLLRVVEHTKDEQLRLERVWAVGNYAIGMEWGDGHNSGIYSFDYLFQIGSGELDREPADPQ